MKRLSFALLSATILALFACNERPTTSSDMDPVTDPQVIKKGSTYSAISSVSIPECYGNNHMGPEHEHSGVTNSSICWGFAMRRAYGSSTGCCREDDIIDPPQVGTIDDNFFDFHDLQADGNNSNFESAQIIAGRILTWTGHAAYIVDESDSWASVKIAHAHGGCGGSYIEERYLTSTGLSGCGAATGFPTKVWYKKSNPPCSPSLNCPTPGQPNLLSPAHLSTLAKVTPITLSWSVPSGNPTTYHLQVTESGETVFYDNSNLTSTSHTFSPNTFGELSYQWKVRAKNGGGWGSWSSTRAFNVISGIPSNFNVSPTTHSNPDQDVTVSWSQVLPANGYKIYRKLMGQSSFFLIQTITSGSTTSWVDTTVPWNEGSPLMIWADYKMKSTLSGGYESAYTAVKRSAIP